MFCDRCLKSCKQPKFAIVVYCPSFEAMKLKPESKSAEKKCVKSILRHDLQRGKDKAWLKSD